MKSFVIKTLVALGCLVAVATIAQAQTTFPITLLKTGIEPAGFMSNSGTRLTWHSSIPGLSFCVAYGAAHGANIGPMQQGHLYTEDITHCLVTDNNGNASDAIGVEMGSGNNPIVIANLILVNNQVNTVIIPMNQIHPSGF
jgi:hypothetical protein